MTNKNFKIALATIFVITIGTITISDANASNVAWFWTNPNQNYICTSGLNSLASTSNVSGCGDLSTSAQTINAVSGSTFTLTEGSSGTPIYAWNNSLDAETVAETSIYRNPTTLEASTGYVVVNRDLGFGDLSAGDPGSLYDYITVMTHEFGHIAGLDERYSGNTSMYFEINTGDVRRTFDSHDRSELGGLYS